MTEQTKDTLEPRTLINLPKSTWEEVYNSPDIKNEFYPEVYLSLLANLALEDKTRLKPLRNSRFKSSETWVADKHNLDKRLVTIVDTFASILVQKPRDNVYAVGLVYEGVPNPRIFIGGNESIEPEVEDFYRRVWECMGDIAHCFEELPEGKGKVDDPSPKRKVKDRIEGDEDVSKQLREAKLQLLEVLALRSFKKLRHRILKRFKDLESIINEKDKQGWSEKKAEMFLKHIYEGFGALLSMTEPGKGGELSNITSKEARTFAIRLVHTKQGLTSFLRTTGGAPRTIDDLLELADKEIAENKAASGFDIRRYMRKVFALLYRFHVLTRAARSWRVFQGFLSRPLEVVRLSPASRKFVGVPNRLHVETLVTSTLAAARYNSLQRIKDVMEDEMFQRAFEKLGDEKAEASAEASDHRKRPGLPPISEGDHPTSDDETTGYERSTETTSKSPERPPPLEPENISLTSPLPSSLAAKPLRPKETGPKLADVTTGTQKVVFHGRNADKTVEWNDTDEAISEPAKSKGGAQEKVKGVGAGETMVLEDTPELGATESSASGDKSASASVPNEKQVLSCAYRVLALAERNISLVGESRKNNATRFVESRALAVTKPKSHTMYRTKAREFATRLKLVEGATGLELGEEDEKKKYDNIIATFDQAMSTWVGGMIPAMAPSAKQKRAISRKRTASQSSRQSSTTGEINFWKARETRPVHCETLVLMKLHELTHAPTPTKCFPFIGVSKLCCYSCATYFDVYNLFVKPKFYVRGSHQRIYDQLTLPSVGKDLDEDIEDQMVYHFCAEIVRIAQRKPPDAVQDLSSSILTESSIGEDFSKLEDDDDDDDISLEI